jgi:hypothetical protein
VTVGLAVNGLHPLARSATARTWANDCDRTQLGWITDRYEGPSSGLCENQPAGVEMEI